MDYCSNHGKKGNSPSLGHLNRMELLKEEHDSTRNGSNNDNGFKVDRYFLDTGSAYNSSHSKQSNAEKQH